MDNARNETAQLLPNCHHMQTNLTVSWQL